MNEQIKKRKKDYFRKGYLVLVFGTPPPLFYNNSLFNQPLPFYGKSYELTLPERIQKTQPPLYK